MKDKKKNTCGGHSARLATSSSATRPTKEDTAKKNRKLAQKSAAVKQSSAQLHWFTMCSLWCEGTLDWQFFGIRKKSYRLSFLMVPDHFFFRGDVFHTFAPRRIADWPRKGWKAQLSSDLRPNMCRLWCKVARDWQFSALFQKRVQISFYRFRWFPEFLRCHCSVCTGKNRNWPRKALLSKNLRPNYTDSRCAIFGTQILH